MPSPVWAAASPSSTPATLGSLVADLHGLGVELGDVVLAHTSMRAIGWVIGGEQAIIDALLQSVGPSGTLVMPTQSWQLCDPAFLGEDHIPESWWPIIRQQLPPYDAARTPTRTMGAVAELFRTYPGTIRSAHPHRSISANGLDAAAITACHDLNSPAGERSPLAQLYELNARVLLLGVGPRKMTALHLAEYRATYPGKRDVPNGGPVLIDGRRVWETWEELDVHDHDFAAVTEDFADHHPELVNAGTIGAAPSLLLSMTALIDHATSWFSAHR
jgi:aminoglycoside 3-N-acetyltransferase